MNWYKVFYWLTVADGVRDLFNTIATVTLVVSCVSLFAIVICVICKSCAIDDNRTKNDQEDKTSPTVRAWALAMKYFRIIFIPAVTVCIISACLSVFVPTKKDCLLIVAGGTVGNFIQSDSSAKQLPSDITRFLHLSLKKEISDLSEDAQEELGVGPSVKKKQFLNKVKSLTKEELLEYIKSDTTILN